MINFLSKKQGWLLSFALFFIVSSQGTAKSLEPIRLRPAEEADQLIGNQDLEKAENKYLRTKAKPPKDIYIERGLQQLNLPLDSKVLTDILQRLVLERINAEEAPFSKGQKLDILYKLGRFEALLRHLSSLSEKEQSPSLMEHVFMALCFQATIDAKKMAEMAAKFYDQKQTEFWKQASIYTEALTHNATRAELNLNVMREDKFQKDSQFLKLMDKLVYNLPVQEFKNPTVLDLAIARSAAIAIPDSFLESSNPPLLVAIVYSENLSLEARLKAAEKALDYGAVEPEVLISLYAKVQFPEDQISQVLKNKGIITQKLSAAKKRALFYQACKKSGGEKRAELLEHFWKHDNGISYASLVAVSYALLNDLIPDEELGWFAPEAIKALSLFPGSHNYSKKWIELAERESPEAWLTISPLLSLASSSPIAAEDRDDWFTKWFHIKSTQDPRGAKEKALLLANLLNAMGKPLKPHTLRDLQISFMSEVHPGVVETFYSKSQEGRSIEEIIVSAAKKMSKTKKSKDWVRLAQVVGKLHQFGLSEDASRLAIEIALKNHI